MFNDVMLLHQDGRPGCRGPFMWNLKSKVMCIIESLNEADTSHRCHQLVDVNLSMSLKEVIPCLPSLHRALYINLLYWEGRGGHVLCTHSLKMLQTYIRSSKWLLKTKHAQAWSLTRWGHCGPPLQSWGEWGRSTNASHHWGRVYMGILEKISH